MIEGNTSGGVVANKTRTVKYVLGTFRPHFPASFTTSKALVIDGLFGYNSIACLQKVLGVEVDGILGKITVKAWQKRVRVTADGAWGSKTTKAAQKFLGVKVDGYFGPESVKALQRWINRNLFLSGAKADQHVSENVRKLSDKAKELAWEKGTDKARYAWDGGAPTEAFRAALNMVYPERKNWSKAPRLGCCCDVFVGTVVRASGIDPAFPRGFDEQIIYKSNKFDRLEYHNVTPYSASKDGDIVLYTKNAKGTSKHVLLRGNGVIYEAQHEKTYGHVNTAVKKLDIRRPKVVILRVR